MKQIIFNFIHITFLCFSQYNILSKFKGHFLHWSWNSVKSYSNRTKDVCAHTHVHIVVSWHTSLCQLSVAQMQCSPYKQAWYRNIEISRWTWGTGFSTLPLPWANKWMHELMFYAKSEKELRWYLKEGGGLTWLLDSSWVNGL